MFPFLKWAGGKSRLLPQLAPHFPNSMKRYMEPFVGAGAVFLSIDQSVPSIINDSNPEIIELYEVVRDSPDSLMSALDTLLLKYSESFYYNLRAKNPSENIDRAARTIFLNKCGFNGLYRLNAKGGFNVPFGKRENCPALYDRENILSISSRLGSVTILNKDFESVIELATSGDFVYCDPPYAPISKTSSFSSYTAAGFSFSDQIRLMEACDRAGKRGAAVAISNSSSPRINELYKNWRVVPILAKRHINSKGNLRGNVQEILALS